MHCVKKSCIRETKHPLTDVDSSISTKKILLVRQNSLKIKLFLRVYFTHFYKQKFSKLRPILFITFLSVKIILKRLIKERKGGSELEACPEYEEDVAQNGILTLTRLNCCSVLTSKTCKIQNVSLLWLVGMVFQALTSKAVKIVRCLI